MTGESCCTIISDIVHMYSVYTTATQLKMSSKLKTNEEVNISINTDIDNQFTT